MRREKRMNPLFESVIRQIKAKKRSEMQEFTFHENTPFKEQLNV